MTTLRQLIDAQLDADADQSNEAIARAVLLPLSREDIVELTVPLVVQEVWLARNDRPGQAEETAPEAGLADTQDEPMTNGDTGGDGKRPKRPRTLREIAEEDLAEVYVWRGNLVRLGDMSLEQITDVFQTLRMEKRKLDHRVGVFKVAIATLKANPSMQTLNELRAAAPAA